MKKGLNFGRMVCLLVGSLLVLLRESVSDSSALSMFVQGHRQGALHSMARQTMVSLLVVQVAPESSALYHPVLLVTK